MLTQVPSQVTEPEKVRVILRIVQTAARKLRIKLPVELENELVGILRREVGDREFDLVVIDELSLSIGRAFRRHASVLRRYSKQRLQELLSLMTPAERNEVVAILTGACKQCGSQMPADEPKESQGTAEGRQE